MNAYTQLVQAAQALERAEIFEKEEPSSDEEIRAFLETYQLHLDAAREALTRECRVEVEYSEEFFEKHKDDCFPISNLARGFRMELFVAERDGRFADAVRAGVNGLDLAAAVRRGGLIVDMLVAIAVSGIAADGLRQVRHRLGLDELRLLIRELVRVESEREPLAAVFARDEEWERRVPSDGKFDPSEMKWPEGDREEALDEEAKQAIAKMIAQSANRPREERLQDFRENDNRDVAFLRLLAVESALLAYRLTHDCLPESLGRSRTGVLQCPAARSVRRRAISLSQGGQGDHLVQCGSEPRRRWWPNGILGCNLLRWSGPVPRRRGLHGRVGLWRRV